MLWAASTVCFFGFSRAGELTIPSDNAFDPTTHLTVEDITIDDIANPSLLKLHLKAFKIDPFRKGVDVVVGRTSDKLCPVAATLAYLALRGNSPGFLFKFRDGRPLTKARFVEAVRSALATAGLNPKDYAGHSFRIGAATTAHSRGLNDSTIQTLGRWSSSAYLVYIKTPKEQLAVFSSNTEPFQLVLSHSILVFFLFSLVEFCFYLLLCCPGARTQNYNYIII